MEVPSGGPSRADSNEVSGQVPGSDQASGVPQPTTRDQVPKLQLMRWPEVARSLVNRQVFVEWLFYMLWKCVLRSWVLAYVSWTVLTASVGVSISYLRWVEILYLVQAGFPLLGSAQSLRVSVISR